MQSKKMFAVQLVKGNLVTRLPKPEDDSKFNPETQFGMYEESDYLAAALMGHPYATFTTDDRDAMEYLIQNGYTHSDGKVYRPFFAYWKDQEGHAFLVDEASNMNELKDVGVLTFMKKPADFMKVGKYSNRLFAPAIKSEPTLIEIKNPKTGEIETKVYVSGLAVWGDEVSWNPTANEAVVLVDAEEDSDLTEEDRELSILYVDLDTLTKEEKAFFDGNIYVSEKAVRRLRLSHDPTIGMVWRGTFGTQRGLGKGHIVYKPGLEVDIVIYGPKTIVKTERFFFASMGRLHVGNPHTDVQAYVNFRFDRPGLAVELAKKYMRSVIAAMKNEAALRRLLLRYSNGLELEGIDQDRWSLRYALKYGVSFLRFPGLYRRVKRYLMTKVMQCEKGRIPMSGEGFSVAKTAYVIGDIHAVDDQGMVDLSKAIPEGTIVFPDLPAGTKVVCYRQPSENSNAWVELTVTYRPEYKRFKGQGVCLLGRGAYETLKRLGGGDMDDSFIIIHDPAWVAAFHTLPKYPETEKITEEKIVEGEEEYGPMSELDQFEDELMADIRDRGYMSYTNDHVSWQMELARNARAGIGPVVNYGILDAILSAPDQVQSMIADLGDQKEFVEFLEAYRDAVYEGDDKLPGTTPTGYHARKFMTNLELVIDGNVKDRTLLNKLGDVSGAIKAFHKACKVYPSSMARRIPKSKWDVPEGEVIDYRLARSLTCRSLETIQLLREKMEEIFLEREWSIVTPADRELRYTYRQERELHSRVSGIWRNIAERGDVPEWERVDGNHPTLMGTWDEEWLKVMAIPNNPELESGMAYKRILGMIQDMVAGEDDEMMRRLAVEVYYQTYKSRANVPKVDPNSGKLRNFKDGLLWSPVFANHFIDALRHAKDFMGTKYLAGYYKVVELRPEFRNRLLSSKVEVEVRRGLVFVQDSDDLYTVHVGHVYGRYLNGIFPMDGGLIEFRKGHKMIQPVESMGVEVPLTRLFLKVEAERVEPSKEEPKGAFGKILNKALDILGLKKHDLSDLT